MGGILDQRGDLAEVPLAAVLIDALNGRATGVLTVEHDGGASRVFLRDGIPVGAQSFAGFNPLGKALLADGLIDVDALGKSLAEMARTGRQQGDVLVEMGLVTRAQVDEALSRQQASYLARIAGLGAGSFRFDPAAEIPRWTAGIRIRPLAAIVEALERPQANALVMAALQPAAAAPIALEPRYGRLADAFGFSDAEAAFVARLERPALLEALFGAGDLAPERARALVAALLLLGLAAPRAAADEASDTVTPVVVDLVDLAGEPVAAPEPDAASLPEDDAPPWPATAAPAAAPTAPPARRAPLRRSDPEEARRRRQRLLQRAMQNMGVGPLSGQPPPPGAHAHAAPPAGGEARVARAQQTPAERELRKALEAAAPRAASPDLFERLGVERSATREQVKQAYFHLAKQLHPDRFGSPALADLAPRVKDLFASVNEAYEVLSDDAKRAELAAKGGGGARGGDAGGQAALDVQKAEACARTRDYARARGFFEAALRADPRPEYQAAFASMLLNEPRRPDLARARALAQAALRDPTCDRAAYVCGLLARDDGDDDRAERLFRQAIAHNPRNADAEHELRAVEARRRGRGSTTGGFFRRR